MRTWCVALSVEPSKTDLQAFTSTTLHSQVLGHGFKGQGVRFIDRDSRVLEWQFMALGFPGESRLGEDLDIELQDS